MAFCFTQTPGIAWDEFDGEAVLVDLAQGRVWTLNPTATYIWRQCRNGARPEQIAGALANAKQDRATTKTETEAVQSRSAAMFAKTEVVQAKNEAVRAETEAFMAELEAQGLLQKNAPRPSVVETPASKPAKPPKLPYVAPKILREETLARPHPPVNPNSVSKLPP